MWHREPTQDMGKSPASMEPRVLEEMGRRAYYRVAGILPIRLTALARQEVDAAIFDLSISDPMVQAVEDAGEYAGFLVRLGQIEEKLDLLLGAASIDVPRPLCGRDRQPVVFSGSGMSLDVTWSFRRGDAYHIEILLPSPYSRMVRAVGLAVQDARREAHRDAPQSLALELRHMETEERDALIAYSYDLQRIALRSRGDEQPEP